MNLRRALSYVSLGIGATAVANAVLRQESGELPPALDGMQRTYRWRGMNVAYTESGDTNDPDLVLLHGINAAASSGEWRALFDRLSEEYHVVAPDLPGFGRSDRPAVRYSAAFYEEFVADFLAEFSEDGGDHEAGEAPTVIASSLSAAYAVHAAQSVAVDRFYLVCPTATSGPGGQKEWVRELLRLPLAGEALFNLIVSKPAIEYFNADHGYADPSGADEEWEAYEWETAHQQNARFAPASFVAGDLDSTLDLGATLAELDVPTTLIWGRETELTPVSDGRALAKAAGAELLVVDRAKLLPHVERADAFVDYVLEGELPDDFSAVREYDPEEEAGVDEEPAEAETDEPEAEEEPGAETEDEDDAASDAEEDAQTADDDEADHDETEEVADEDSEDEENVEAEE